MFWKICSKFTGRHPCRKTISVSLQSKFIEITLRHGCPSVNLLYIFRTPFHENTSGGLLLFHVIKCMRPQGNFHYLSAIPATEKKKKPTRRCQYCSSKKNRKESRYHCLRCNESPVLCVDLCFRQFHVRIGVALKNSDSSDCFDASDMENEPQQMLTVKNTKAVLQRCSYEKVFWKIYNKYITPMLKCYTRAKVWLQ